MRYDKMRSQTLISTLVWIAVLCFTRVVSDEKSELADKLNILMHHLGWQAMDVKITPITSKASEDPITEMLNAISRDRNPVDVLNVQKKYKEIWTVLMCKYAQVIYDYRILLEHLIRVCQNEKQKENDKTTDFSLRMYYGCFNRLLIRVQSASPKFKCMRDALDFYYSLGQQSKRKHNVMVVTQKLTEFTSTLLSSTMSKVSKYGFNEEWVDLEMKYISENVLYLLKKNLDWFVDRHCIISVHTDWTPENFNSDYNSKKNNHTIPPETTMLQYVENKMDVFVNDISDSCFFKLGFAYDGAENLKIAIN